MSGGPPPQAVRRGGAVEAHCRGRGRPFAQIAERPRRASPYADDRAGMCRGRATGRGSGRGHGTAMEISAPRGRAREVSPRTSGGQWKGRRGPPPRTRLVGRPQGGCYCGGRVDQCPARTAPGMCGHGRVVRRGEVVEAHCRERGRSFTQIAERPRRLLPHTAGRAGMSPRTSGGEGSGRRRRRATTENSVPRKRPPAEIGTLCERLPGDVAA